MNDGIEQHSSDVVHRTILRFGNLAQRSLIGWFVRQAQGLIQNMRRHVIRMGDITHIHPAVDWLILMLVPVDYRPRCSHDKERGN